MPVFTSPNYWPPTVGKPPHPHPPTPLSQLHPSRPSASFSQPIFQPNSFSFPLNGWTRIKKLSGTLNLSWQKSCESVQESCLCLLLQTTCSFARKTLSGEGRGKPQTAHSQLFIQSKTSVSVFDFENVPTGLSPYQSLAVHWSLCLAPGLFSVKLWMHLNVLLLWWHMLIHTSSAKSSKSPVLKIIFDCLVVVA